MTPASPPSWRQATRALLRSYIADLRGWIANLAIGHGIAVAMLAGSVLTFFATIAVGVTALFHFLQHRYGMEVAYGAIGGGLQVLAIVLFLSGWTLLRRRTPPLPRPRRQAQAAKQMMMGSAALGAVARFHQMRGAAPDPMTGLLAGAAVTLLIGWIVGSRLQSSRERRVQR